MFDDKNIDKFHTVKVKYILFSKEHRHWLKLFFKLELVSMVGLIFIDGDITRIKRVDTICHQVNCLTVKAHGLSSVITKTYPWANIYSKRIAIKQRNLATVETRGEPGDITLYDDGEGFHVVCLHAQWEYGKCFHSHRAPIKPYIDTPRHRLEWLNVIIMSYNGVISKDVITQFI